MTVVPGTADGRFHLICDRCGQMLMDAAGNLLDTEVVWPLLAEQEWTGSPFATGPHQCPDCSMAESTPPARSLPDGAQDSRSSPHCRVETADLDTAVVTIRGAIDRSGAEPVRDALAHAIALHRNIIVDMAAVPTIDPTGLSVLVHAHQDAKQRGGCLCLAAPSRVIRTVLHTMRLDRILLTFEDRADAIVRFAWARTPPDDNFRPGGPILFEVKEHDVITPWPPPDDGVNPYLADESYPADEKSRWPTSTNASL
ncbi:STAS domain-containing protein [Actinomycetes bacterium KLBMP 9797]